MTIGVTVMADFNALYQNHSTGCVNVGEKPRQRRYAPRSRLGCLSCRIRKKRCSGEQPLCANCDRLNLDCVWEKRRSVVTTSDTAERLSSSLLAPREARNAHQAAVSRPQLIPVGLSYNTSAQPDEYLTMTYYIHSFVPKISVCSTPSSYHTSLYVTMAFQCDGVRNAITAVSASHLAKATNDQSRAQHFKALALAKQQRCHEFLKDRLTLSGQLLDERKEVAALILLLVGLELQNGAVTRKWIRQLDCVRNIIAKFPAEDNSWESDCIKRHFLYHDVMAIIMTGVSDETVNQSTSGRTAHSINLNSTDVLRMPWEDGQAFPLEQTQVEDIRMTSSHPAHIDPLMGVAQELFIAIQHIRHLPALDMGVGVSPESLLPYIEIEHRLSTIAFGDQPASFVDTATQLDLVTLAEAYRLAALILLYRQWPNNNSAIPSLATRIIRLTERIPQRSTAEAGLMYPLFLAGAELVQESEIEICATRLRRMREQAHILNVQSAEEVLEEVWRGVLNGGNKRDWEDVLRSWDWVVSLG